MVHDPARMERLEEAPSAALTTGGHGEEGPRRVDALVVALVPEFGQAIVEDSDGYRFALTRRTEGFDPGTYSEGQRVTCTVTSAPVRVLSVRLAA